MVKKKIYKRAAFISKSEVCKKSKISWKNKRKEGSYDEALKAWGGGGGGGVKKEEIGTIFL